MLISESVFGIITGSAQGTVGRFQISATVEQRSEHRETCIFWINIWSLDRGQVKLLGHKGVLFYFFCLWKHPAGFRGYSLLWNRCSFLTVFRVPYGTLGSVCARRKSLTHCAITLYLGVQIFLMIYHAFFLERLHQKTFPRAFILLLEILFYIQFLSILSV